MTTGFRSGSLSFACPFPRPFRLANAYAIIGTWKRKSLSHRGTARSAAQPLYGSRALPWCSICVPFWPRTGFVHVPIVFRKGPANHHDPATKRNIMEQNGTHFSAQPSIVRPKRPPPTCLRAPSLSPRQAVRRGPSTRRHFRSGPRPQLRRDCHIFTQFGSFRMQTVFNQSQIGNPFPAPSAMKSDRMLRNVILLGGFTFNSGPPSGAPPTPSPFKKDCRRRRPRASVECAGAYLAPPLL